MAKPENQETVTGGLSFVVEEETAKNGVDPSKQTGKTQTQEVETEKETSEEGSEVNALKAVYQQEHSSTKERVNIRKQFTVTPTLSKQLAKATKNGDIKSANHLVNFLLEKWFSGELTLKEKK